MVEQSKNGHGLPQSLFEWDVSIVPACPSHHFTHIIGFVVWSANGRERVDMPAVGETLMPVARLLCRPPWPEASWVPRPSTPMQPDNLKSLTARHRDNPTRIYSTRDGWPRLHRPISHRQLEGRTLRSGQTGCSFHVIREAFVAHFDAGKGVRASVEYSENCGPMVGSFFTPDAGRASQRPCRALKARHYL